MLSSVPALLPLSLLEAVQNIDTPADDGLGALQEELASKRLGLSPTVAAQVATMLLTLLIAAKSIN